MYWVLSCPLEQCGKQNVVLAREKEESRTGEQAGSMVGEERWEQREPRTESKAWTDRKGKPY